MTKTLVKGGALLCMLVLGVLFTGLTGCSRGSGDSPPADTPNSTWDSMNWDQGTWD